MVHINLSHLVEILDSAVVLFLRHLLFKEDFRNVIKVEELSIVHTVSTDSVIQRHNFMHLIALFFLKLLESSRQVIVCDVRPVSNGKASHELVDDFLTLHFEGKVGH